MNEKYIERPKKFDQKEYDKIHFKSFTSKIKPNLWQEIDDYCKDQNISKSEFLRRALEALKELDK